MMTATTRGTFEQAGVWFEPVAHRYTYMGQSVINTTSVIRNHRLSADLSQIPPDVLDKKRAIGLAAHAATHYFDEGDLHPLSVEPPVIPYLDAWRRFVEENEFEPILLETMLVHPGRLYGGTIDRWGIVHRLNPSGLPSIVDLKTGDPEFAAAGVQTAAYEQLVRAVLPEIFDHLSAVRAFDFTLSELIEEPWTRYSVQLLPTGRYKLHKYDEFEDLKTFNWALSLDAKAHPSWRNAR